MNGRGSAFLLKLGSGDPLSYVTVAGLKTEVLSICGEAFEGPRPLDQPAWRELLSGAGERSVSISASGIFTSTRAESQIKRLALAGEIAPFELHFENGEVMSARFIVTRLEYRGNFNGERDYRLALESSREVVVK